MFRRFALCCAALLAGCSYLHPRVQIDDTAAIAAPTVAAEPVLNGAIFQAARYRPLFEDHRARLVGDTLTVQIVEKVNASQKSTSSIDKSGSIASTITALPGIKSNSFGRAGAAGSSENKFDGKGSTENSNDFSGTITVVVKDVLPNGQLLISGEKQIGVNSNVDVLRFTGLVDPRTIQPGNTVASAQIACSGNVSRLAPKVSVFATFGSMV